MGVGYFRLGFVTYSERYLGLIISAHALSGSMPLYSPSVNAPLVYAKGKVSTINNFTLTAKFVWAPQLVRRPISGGPEPLAHLP